MHIAIFLYEGFTALDAIGPYEVLSRLPRAHVDFVAKKRGLIAADTGFLKVEAARSFEDMTDADLLVIPGGPMTGELGEHPEIRAWLHQMVDRVERLATVCTGSLIASRAGLLNDVRATTHWACIDELAANGATAVQERVVIDGKYYSAAGVSAGIDLALTLVGDIAGSDRAQAIQLLIEYDPAPPFEAGSPKTAPAAVLARVQKRLEKLRATRHNDA